MAILLLCEVVKRQGIPGARKESAVVIALDECVLKTSPDVQKLNLGAENGLLAKLFFC
jgi:hypothetical protein